MERRIVINFCTTEGGSGRSFLERARALTTRASSEGGILVAWGELSVAFAFKENALPSVIGLVAISRLDSKEGEAPWSCGIAQGELQNLSKDGSRGGLASGPPIIAAASLARTARPGEVLVAPTLSGLRAGQLLTRGVRVARDGNERISGARLDVAQPWRTDGVEQLARIVTPAFAGVDLSKIPITTRSLVVIRADPGAGGTRCLQELAKKAPRALFLSPSGAGLEPLGSLRVALAHSITRELAVRLVDHAEPLRALISGEGLPLEHAVRLVLTMLQKSDGDESPGLLVIDDARAVDAATLEVAVRATRSEEASFGVIARLDATGGMPSVVASLPKSREVEIDPLSRPSAEALAGAFMAGQLDETSRQRFGKLGGSAPLGIVEALSWGIVRGDITWNSEVATCRTPASGRGKARAAAEWIVGRADQESDEHKNLLCLLALLGGQAKATRLSRILEEAKMPILVNEAVAELTLARWVVKNDDGWVELPSRSHRDALATLLEEPEKKALHHAAAEVLEKEEGTFGRVQAAWHAQESGDGQRAARIALAAARAPELAGFEGSTTQLIAFARKSDPTCEQAAMEVLADAVKRAPSGPPGAAEAAAQAFAAAHEKLEKTFGSDASSADIAIPPIRVPADMTPDPAPAVVKSATPVHASELPSDMPTELKPRPSSYAPPPGDKSPISEPGSKIAMRLGQLAKGALLNADNAALEVWVDGLKAAGENPVFTDRMRALSQLGRGDVGDALRVLRKTRTTIDPGDHLLRCQTSLALGVVLAVAGRTEEALLEGMDALARARQVKDSRGARACTAFLAKLFSATGRPEAATLLNPPSGT